MKTKDKIIVTLLFFCVLSFAIYLIRSILLPFIFSFVIAYFLNPLVDNLCKKRKMSRLTATSLIIGLFSTFMTAFLVVISPVVYEQVLALILAIPQYVTVVADDIYPRYAEMLNHAGIKVNADLMQTLLDSGIYSSAVDFMKKFAFGAFSSTVAFVNILSLVFITPILIFYLLKDWDILVEKINSYIPKQFAGGVIHVEKEISETMSGYIRGQINVCLVMAAVYCFLLTIIGLNFGFVIGLATGFLIFIPYVGALSGFTVSVIVALFQWGFEPVHIFSVIGVFIFGQILESNFLTPKFIGTRVGLHPLWIIFGLFVFGVIFGFLGMLFATPLTALCGVFARYLAFEYKKRLTHHNENQSNF